MRAGFFFDVIFSIEDDVIEVNLIGRLLTHLDSFLDTLEQPHWTLSKSHGRTSY